MTKTTEKTINLDEIDNLVFQRLCGVFDENLKTISKILNISVKRVQSQLILSGDNANEGLQSIKKLLEMAKQKEINNQDIRLITLSVQSNLKEEDHTTQISLKTYKGRIKGRTPNQSNYIQALMKYDIIFGLGPAGTGKTYLAVAAAVNAMEQSQIEKIILVRPAVEAGEKLGFLPGDLTQKIDPYLRPLYDALYELMGYEKVSKLFEKGLIELAPLAYMRGRTLNNAFIILDEAQNTTKEQMKMFLTRIGFGTKTVITGDLSQIDLPRHVLSGLKDACEKLDQIEGILFHYFDSKDIVRHPLVQKIVNAYDQDKHFKNDTKPKRKLLK